MLEPYTCARCNRHAKEIDEYRDNEENMTAVDFMLKEEGTYNGRTKRFLCTICYIIEGQPSLPHMRWMVDQDYKGEPVSFFPPDTYFLEMDPLKQ